MGDAACLRRSFSSPSGRSHDFSQGEVTRVLGESISFGRYMTESLEWEKWSAFTSNRYLEEAEKYSKPGSVAKMKAYFDAHYGRFGAKKKSVKEHTNDVSSEVEVNVEDSLNADVVSSSPRLISKTVPAINTYSTIHESPMIDNPDEDLVSCGMVSSYSCSAQSNEVQHESTGALESVALADALNCSLEVQVHQSRDVEAETSVTESPTVNTFKDIMEIKTVSSTQERKVTVKKEAEQKEKLDSVNKQKLTKLSLKTPKKSNLSNHSASLNTLATPVRCKKEGNGTPNTRAVSKVSSFLARLSTPARSTKEGNSNRKLAKESTEKKKLVSSAVYMSTNVNTNINVAKKPTPASRQTGVAKVFTPLGKIVRDSFASFSTPNRASVNSVSRHPSATPQSETRRSRVALEKSFDRSRRLDQNLKTPSFGNVKTPLRSPATFASFSFRTEERAAKRKELFQRKLEKEAESLQMVEQAKVKPTPDSRKTSQSRNLTANTEILSNSINKIPPSGVQPPKCEAKPAMELIQDKGVRPPQRTAISKPSIGKSKALPSKLMTKKKTNENTSPNIL